MKKRNNEDYVHFIFIYIHKHIAYCFIFLCIVLPFVIFHEDTRRIYENLTNQQTEWREFVYTDTALMEYEGKIRLLNEQGMVIYEGFFAQGKCNGSGTIYRDGKKIYEGNLVDNRMEDISGTLYKNDTKIYEGEIYNNQRNGTGVQYREDGSLEYKGAFVNDRFEGQGMAYDEDGNIVYEGAFLDGIYHGKGILYEEGDSILKVYEGDFAFGEANGTGILYDTWGTAYYEGPVVYNHINYTSYFSGTLKDVKDHFHYPLKYYVYENQIAVVIEQLGLAFLCKEIDLVNKENETWTWKEDVVIDELLFRKIYMADDDLETPGAIMQKEDVVETWSGTAICKDQPAILQEEDLFAISLSKEEIFSSIGGEIELKGNGFYEISIENKPIPGFIINCALDDIQIGYHSYLPMDKALFSVMETNTKEAFK